MTAYYKYKNKITDDMEDAYEIIRVVGKAIVEGNAEKNAIIDNLARAMKKIESAKYYIDRE
jgi:hypothetical protein